MPKLNRFQRIVVRLVLNKWVLARIRHPQLRTMLGDLSASARSPEATASPAADRLARAEIPARLREPVPNAEPASPAPPPFIRAESEVAKPASAGISNALIVPTAYGLMIVNRHDINQTNALVKTGRAIDHEEITLLAATVRTLGGDRVFLDVGACFGTYALGLAGCVGARGRIHAFEPQRQLFNMLAGSVALGSHAHIVCHNLALGAREGTLDVPQFDYDKPLNFGSIEFGSTQKEPLSQERGFDAGKMERVPVTTLDKLGFDQVDLIKIDVEGMELAVLDGAKATIKRHRPILFVETLKVDGEALVDRMTSQNYRVMRIGINILCVPEEKVAHLDEIFR